MREKRKLFAVRNSVAIDAENWKEELSNAIGVGKMSWTQFFALLLKHRDKTNSTLTTSDNLKNNKYVS
jgi:hypothetical protein